MTEAVARFGGRGTRELAELGGREAAEKLLARVSAAGGERLARRTVSLVRELGPEGLRALRAAARHPGAGPKLLETFPARGAALADRLSTGAGLTAVLNLGNRAMRPDGAVREPDGTTRPSAPLDRAVSAATRGVFSGGFPGIYLRLLAVVAGGLLGFRILMAVRRFFGWLTAPLASSRRRADRSGATRAAESPADSRR